MRDASHAFREVEQRERIPTRIHFSTTAAAATVAAELRALIEANSRVGRRTVLGLATGSTPVPLYRELIRLHREEGLSFRDVVTFNLDEYHGLDREHPQSYWRFMHQQLFDHVDVRPENIHVPDGTVPRAEIFGWCANYERQIAEAGGIDWQILGIGRTGHIGFNEPGSGRDSRTRLVTLDATTRRDAARDFLGEENVPRHAITMGVATILSARRIVLLAWGRAKSGVLATAVEGPISESLPASYLQAHGAVEVHADEAAAAGLTRRRLPWLVAPVAWDDSVTRRALAWMAQKLDKPLLKLVDEDYAEQGLSDLLTERGSAYAINIGVFNQLQHTITGWPGGRPGADDTHRPERAIPYPKRVLVFSPEPSDDVVGMGGTLGRLADQGHDITVAYLVSGSLGVPDEEACAAADLAISILGAAAQEESNSLRVARETLRTKRSTDADAADVRKLKALIRRGEAREALRSCGISADRICFLDLAFYENGQYRQFRASDDDVDSVLALLRERSPHQLFATGMAADNGSVAAVAFEIVQRALERAGDDKWREDCRIWLYRDLKCEWNPEEIEMAVPLSPAELSQKLQSIYRHRSQRSQRPAATGAPTEFWQQAEEYNRSLARLYDRLGLAEYEAIEAFQRLRP